MRADAAKFSKILQLFPEEAQKLIELESMSESEKRDALQKIAFERDVRLQARIDSDRYLSENRNYLDAYLGFNAKRYQPAPARSFFSKASVFSIPSQLGKQSMSRVVDSSRRGNLQAQPQIGDPAFQLKDVILYGNRKALNRSFFSTGVLNKSRNKAKIDGVIEFSDYQVGFDTTLSTSLTIDEIKRNIIENWFLIERHQNKNFEASQDNFDYICQKSTIDISRYHCPDARITLARFAQTADLNFDLLEVRIHNKLSAASMGVRLKPPTEHKISNFVVDQPNQREDMGASDVITQASFRGPPRQLTSSTHMMSELGNKVMGQSGASTATGTRDKDGPIFGQPLNLRNDPPRVFTDSLPKMTMNAEARTFFCKSHPKLTKGNFQTDPPIERINLMSVDELRNLESFKIWNNFGQIKFSEPVDLTDVALDEAVVIEHGFVDVYPPDRFDGETRPECGSKINRPAIVTLFNVQEGNKGIPMSACLEHLDGLGVEHESWGPETGTLVVSLPYGF